MSLFSSEGLVRLGRANKDGRGRGGLFRVWASLCQWTWPRRHRSGCYSVYSVHGGHGACHPGKDPGPRYIPDTTALGGKQGVRRAAARLLLDDTNRLYAPHTVSVFNDLYRLRSAAY